MDKTWCTLNAPAVFVAAVDPEEYYPYFLERVKDLLDGNMEPGVFEDIVRDLFGIYAYRTFTIDRLIQNIVRQVNAPKLLYL